MEPVAEPEAWSGDPACLRGAFPHIRRMPMAQRATPSAATEVLAGLVERVTFHNDENGFCVLRVKARGQRDLITCWGMPR